MIEIKIDKSKVPPKLKRKPSLNPIAVIALSVLIVGSVVGIGILAASSSSRQNLEKSQEQNERLESREKLSELDREFEREFELITIQRIETFKAIAERKMVFELGQLMSGGDAYEAVAVHEAYYEDMPFEELIVEYKKHYAARWHKIKKDHWPHDVRPLPPEYE